MYYYYYYLYVALCQHVYHGLHIISNNNSVELVLSFHLSTGRRGKMTLSSNPWCHSAEWM